MSAENAFPTWMPEDTRAFFPFVKVQSQEGNRPEAGLTPRAQLANLPPP